MRNYLFLSLLITFNICFSQIEKKIRKPNTSFPKTTLLNGTIDTLILNSVYLNEPREITVYKPNKEPLQDGYGVLIVTDGITEPIANYMDYLMVNNLVQPFIIVGINQRTPQPIDSILKGYNIDFRACDFLKLEIRFEENEEAYKDSTISKLIVGRHPKFLNFVGNEIIPYIKSNYTVSSNKSKWTIGGFSNGGAFAFSFACTFPKLIGNSIVMSPGGTNNYDIKNSDCNFYLCAGKHEFGFLVNSKQYLPLMQEQNIQFLHRTYNAGHDWAMWFDFYIDRVRFIYAL